MIIAIAPEPPSNSVCPKILGLPEAILELTGFLAALKSLIVDPSS